MVTGSLWFVDRLILYSKIGNKISLLFYKSSKGRSLAQLRGHDGIFVKLAQRSPFPKNAKKAGFYRVWGLRIILPPKDAICNAAAGSINADERLADDPLLRTIECSVGLVVVTINCDFGSASNYLLESNKL